VTVQPSALSRRGDQSGGSKRDADPSVLESKPERSYSSGGGKVNSSQWTPCKPLQRVIGAGDINGRSGQYSWDARPEGV
jgi:hypothetical protein